MAGGTKGRSLEVTPTWAVAAVCFVLVLVSIIIEHIIHLIGQWLTKRHNHALFEALEKIKSELMLLGFISLLLTVGQGPISEACISKALGASWHPCSKEQEIKLNKEKENDHSGKNHERRQLLTIPGPSGSQRRALAAAGYDKCAAKDKVPFISADGIHQLHMFIFVLAVSHVLYCIITLALGQAKMRKWKKWEMETRTAEYQFAHDPGRFRFARETSFGRRHLNFWSHSSILSWIVCFFRQFSRSVPKVDYLTLRHGFIIAHLAPQSQTKFDFQKYINRSLEQDFKVVVGISPTIWFFAVLFLLSNAHGWNSYLWLPFIPLIIILVLSTKLQVIIAKMGLRIQERGEVVRGTPVVELGDDLFWFNRPRLVLYLIHFVLFQNAFQLAFFVWAWYEFGLKSCFHEKLADIIIRISMGILMQILCSYVTLPLYALVTQMGSTMKPTIFKERVAYALRKWHQSAKKNIKKNRHSGSLTSSRPETPLSPLSPVHLLQNYRGELDSVKTSPRMSKFENEGWGRDGPLSPTGYQNEASGSSQQRNHNWEEVKNALELSTAYVPITRHANLAEHEINISSPDFSFDQRTRN